MRVYLPIQLDDCAVNNDSGNKQLLPLIIYPFEGLEQRVSANKLLTDVSLTLAELTVPDSSLYSIIFPWAMSESLLLDIHVYHDFNGPWQKANPSITDFPLVYGARRDVSQSCETATIIRGTEGFYRRTTGSLEEYLATRPSLGEESSNGRSF